MNATRPRCPAAATLFLLTVALSAASGDDPAAGVPAADADPLRPDADPPRPNIVWVIAEDASASLFGPYGDDSADTPNLDRMAAEGVTFDHAFSNAPVCSVARTTLFSGVHAPRLGTQFHRRLKPITPPPGVGLFPRWLRDAGYHTTNDAKEDYNLTADADTWDDSSRGATYRDRRPGQPFFHVRTLADTHESRLHFPASDVDDAPTTTDPAAVTVPAFLPDTPLVRYTIARHHDRVTDVDRQLGDLLQQLRDDGVLEQTFVFFFSDHGGVLPRTKGYLYEGGLHVPLVIRIPADFADLIDSTAGDRQPGFISFIDFAPTVLDLADVPPPDSFDGEPFFGPMAEATEVATRDTTIGYADRMDARIDMVRSLREGDLKYIRCYDAPVPDSLRNDYRLRMAAYRQLDERHAAGDLPDAADRFFRPRPPELLFDLSSDPDEVNNLADAPEHRSDLLRLRTRLADELRNLPDLSFLNEIYVVEEAAADPFAYGRDNAGLISRCIDVADLALRPLDEVRRALRAALDDPQPHIRYWAVVAANSMGEAADELLPDIERRLVDLEPFVAARAAEFVARRGGKDPRGNLYRSLNRVVSEVEGLKVLRDVTVFHQYLSTDYPLDDANLRFFHITPDATSPVTRALNNVRR